MAKVSDTYLDLLDKWLYNGHALQHANMTEFQKLRTEIVYEAYQVWLQQKQIDPMDLVRQIADRKYRQMIEASRQDAEVAARCEELGIGYVSPGSDEITRRSVKQLYNDVEALNHIIGTFTAPVTNIERAKVVHASDWLIQQGMKTGDGRDVYKGADLKMRLNKEFDQQQAGYEDIANTDIGITDDVSTVKTDRHNYSAEEKKRFAQKYGISQKAVINMIEKEPGVFEQEEDDTDIFSKDI